MYLELYLLKKSAFAERKDSELLLVDDIKQFLEGELRGKTTLSANDTKALSAKIQELANSKESDYGVKLNEIEFRIFYTLIARWHFPRKHGRSFQACVFDCSKERPHNSWA